VARGASGPYIAESEEVFATCHEAEVAMVLDLLRRRGDELRAEKDSLFWDRCAPTPPQYASASYGTIRALVGAARLISERGMTPKISWERV